MNRTEAIQFYTVKQQRARSSASKSAYTVIQTTLRLNPKPIQHLEYLSKNGATPTGRSIYKKALRELSI